MKADTIVSLAVQGGEKFDFSRYEIPERITFGGRQHLVTHELVGGMRVVDAMGRSDMAITWQGLFLGENALARARFLDYLRTSGKACTLTWSELNYSVIFEEFTADFERFYRIPYRVSFTVLKDMAQPTTAIASAGVDELIRDDMATANGFGGQIGDGTLSSLLGTLDSAIKAVNDFSKATTAMINSVLTPIAAVRNRVNVLIASTGNVLANVTTVGGILPNNPISKQAANLSQQSAAMTQQPSLYNLNSTLDRMGGNMAAIGTGNTQTTVAGGNLYQVASNAYGDPAEWTTIAKANNLSDPQIVGIKTLKIPATTSNSGGIPTA